MWVLRVMDLFEFMSIFKEGQQKGEGRRRRGRGRVGVIENQILFQMMIRGYGSCVDGVVTDADTLDGDDGVLGVGSLGLSPPVDIISTAVGVVPGVVGHNGVPEGICGSAVGEQCSHEAGGKVGLEEACVEVDVDEVLALVVVLEVEAFQVTVVPGVVGEGDAGGHQLLLGGVPVLVVSHQCC